MRSEKSADMSKAPVPFPGSTGVIAAALLFVMLVATGFAKEQAHVEIPRGDQTLVVNADTIETRTGGVLVAEGHVTATYGDVKLTTARVVYSPESDQIIIEGEFEIVRSDGWLKGSRAEMHLESDTGVLFDVTGYTDEELYVKVKRLYKTGPETYRAEDGYLTACKDFVPKWSFRIDQATIKAGGMAKMSHTLFRIKKFPVFYFPYMMFPTGKKDRSSGFMMPSIGNSSNKGRRITQQVYFTLGRSADLMVRGDYYSKRGIGSGFTLRTRPNDRTVFDVEGELVDDRLGSGGGSLIGLGHTRFGNGFRLVADFNLVSNFRFRQVFSDNFFTATRPTETSRIFLTNNYRTASVNVLLSREETVFPGRNVVTRASPSFGFRLSGHRIGMSPFFLDLDSSLGGLNRSDHTLETPRFSQRLDLYPRVYFSVPLFQGLRLSPTFGFRETFYGDSLELEGAERHLSKESIRREYLSLNVDLEGWGVSRIFGDSDSRSWKHLVEPLLRYRYISGIDNFHEIIRFDDSDAIADTSEIEYGLVNRVFVKNGPAESAHEWLSLKIGQKYYFDPTFGGAFVDGIVNQYYPLNTLTGIPYAVSERNVSPITTAARFSPGRRTHFDIRGDYDTVRDEFRGFAVTGFHRMENFSFSGTYFQTEDLIAGIGSSKQVQGRVGFGDFNRGLSAFTSFSYDALSARFLNHLVRVSYYWDCCGISAEVRGFNLSTRQERQIRFAFFLKGIGTFGTIKRPDSVF